MANDLSLTTKQSVANVEKGVANYETIVGKGDKSVANNDRSKCCKRLQRLTIAKDEQSVET